MHKEFEIEKVFTLRLTHKADLLDELNQFCADNNIKNGFISLIGSVSSINLSYYEQDNLRYIDIENSNFDKNKGLEIVSATGNISIKDDKPFVHIHVIVSDEQGNCFAGHLSKDTKTFAGEAVIQKFKGQEDLVRAFDDETKLSLWK